MTQSDIYGLQPRQMDDYGMDIRHYDRCDNCNCQEHYNTEHNDETETEENI